MDGMMKEGALSRSVTTVVLALGFVAVTGLQTNLISQAKEQSSTPQVQPPPTQPTFRSGVTLITTDVIVRDENGQFVATLTEENFQVLEDDVLQEIASLTLVHGGRVYNELEPERRVQEGIVLPSSRPTSDTAGRVFIIFVDDLHMEPLSTPRVRKIFRQISDTLIHEGDLFGVVSTGPSAIAIDMTYDRSLLKIAEDKIMGNGMSYQDIITQMDGARGPAETLFLAHSAFRTAHEVVRNLEFVENRRKAFIYLSTGYDFNPYPGNRLYGRSRMGNRSRGIDAEAVGDLLGEDFSNLAPAADPFSGGPRLGAQFANADMQIELSELAKAANRSNVSFYAVDPRGLMAGPDISNDVHWDSWNRHITQTQDTLRALAQLTGGLAVVNMNDFESGLKQIDAETSDYYVLGYYTSNPDPTIRTRKIEVVVDQDDVSIQHRTRYSFPLPPATVAER